MKTGRNDPCPCGSGLKWKKCCADKEAAAVAARNAEVLGAAPTADVDAPPTPELHTWVPLQHQQGRLRASRRTRKKPF
jgi:hypothetical protein